MDDVFFYLSKYTWKVISPDSLFLIFLTLSLLLLLFRQTTKAGILLFLLTAGTLFLSFYSVGDVMLHRLETRFRHNPPLPEHIDGIIVLGGMIHPETSVSWQQLETNDFHERLSSFLLLAREYPDARLIFSGGNANTDRDKPTEGQVAESYLIRAGITPERLLIENRSRNTAENASYTKQLANPGANENWLLITSAFHMPRAVGVFCKQNWKVIPYPVDHQTVPANLSPSGFNLMIHANKLVMASHEWAGLLAYYLSGKTDQLVPGQCE